MLRVAFKDVSGCQKVQLSGKIFAFIFVDFRLS